MNTLITTGGLTVWQGEEFILNFLFAIQGQFEPTHNARL